MTLRREVVVPGLINELGQFEVLVRSLDETEWKAPSRCGDWSAGDVAGHVIGQLADVAAGRFEGLGTPEVTARQVEERRGRTPAELADELGEVTVVAARSATAARRCGSTPRSTPTTSEWPSGASRT